MRLLACLLLASAAAAGEAPLLPGLIAEYFPLAAGEQPDWPRAGATPALRTVDAMIAQERTEADYGGTPYLEQVRVRWSGVVRIPRAGSWTFALISDDGSRLRVGSAELIDNGGLHGYVEKTGTVTLTAGDHPIVVEHYQGTGGGGIFLGWWGEGQERDAVPPNAFFHRADPTVDRESASPMREHMLRQRQELLGRIMFLDGRLRGREESLAGDARLATQRAKVAAAQGSLDAAQRSLAAAQGELDAARRALRDRDEGLQALALEVETARARHAKLDEQVRQLISASR